MRFLRVSLVAFMMSPSSPKPAMMRKVSFVAEPSPNVACTRPTSMTVSSPASDRAKLSAAEPSTETPRLRASRLPVPCGINPSGTLVPLSAAPTWRTVPSPPAAKTMSQPSRSACCVWPVPGSSRRVCSHSGSAHPASRETSTHSRRRAPRSSTFVGLTTIAARGREGVFDTPCTVTGMTQIRAGDSLEG